YEPIQLVLAMLLLNLCLYPSLRYLLLPEGLPILPIVCLGFAAQFAIPIFTQEPRVPLLFGFRYLDNEEIVAALSLSILGAASMQLAYYALKGVKVSRIIPTVQLNLDPKKVEIYCVAVFASSFILNRLPGYFSEDTFQQFQQVFGVMQNQSLVAIGILCW